MTPNIYIHHDSVLLRNKYNSDFKLNCYIVKKYLTIKKIRL